MGGLFPIMWTTGTGADVMKRIAAPMIGGMVSSTVLTLLVIPILYALWRSRSLHAVDRLPNVPSHHIAQSEHSLNPDFRFEIRDTGEQLLIACIHA